VSGFIPEDIVEQVRANSDIIQIVGAYVKLNRRGRNYLGLCPFHQEKTPSFTVSQEKQFYHCFGCGRGGNVFSFLMEHERMTFPEAARLLAERAGVRIPEREVDDIRRGELEKLYYANQVAGEYFREVLRSPQGAPVREKYLIESRGISQATLDQFGVGYATDNWQGLIDFSAKRDLSPETLGKAGLTILSEERRRWYDRFRERVMIPITNLSDRVIAFGGRTVRSDDPAKYINSPETALYSKSNALFGLNLTRQYIREAGFVIIVEGYFDLISLWQVGIRNVVASSGTAFTQEQGRLLRRFAEEAFLFFDADSAGVKAAIRSVDALFNAGVEVKVMRAPQGHDPDTLARSGAETIQNLISNAERYLQFRFRSLNSAALGPVEKAALTKEIGDIAARISDPTLRGVFTAEAAELLGVDKALVSNVSQRTASTGNPQPSSARRQDDWGARGMKVIEAEFMSFLLAFPRLSSYAAERVTRGHFSSPKLASLFDALRAWTESDDSEDISRFLGALPDDKLRETATFLLTRSWPTETPGDTLRDFVNSIIDATETTPNLETLKRALKEAERASDTDTARRLASEISARVIERDAGAVSAS